MEMTKTQAWLCVIAIYAFVIFALFGTARAETVLEYTACSTRNCVTQQLYGDDADFFACQMHGQIIITKDLKDKARFDYQIKKWTCTLGQRYERL